MNLQKLVRKIHIYVGLSLFLPILLFAASGLMLNHRWQIWDYWAERKESRREIAVQVPAAASDLDKARRVLSQIGVDGEINLLLYHADTDTLEIKTTRPGMMATIEVCAASGQGRADIVELNAWSLLPAMHVLSGLHSNIAQKKNWFWTQYWSLVMDLTAGALLLLLASGFYLWLKITSERRLGLLCLEVGAAVFALVFWFLSRF